MSPFRRPKTARRVRRYSPAPGSTNFYGLARVRSRHADHQPHVAFVLALDALRASRGSQAMVAARSVSGWGVVAVSDTNELRIKRNQRRNARQRFARGAK